MSKDLIPLISKEVEALDPKEYPPPRGRKIILITKGNIQCVGEWDDDCKAWHPLLPNPGWRKKHGQVRESDLNRLVMQVLTVSLLSGKQIPANIFFSIRDDAEKFLKSRSFKDLVSLLTIAGYYFGPGSLDERTLIFPNIYLHKYKEYLEAWNEIANLAGGVVIEGNQQTTISFPENNHKVTVRIKHAIL